MTAAAAMAVAIAETNEGKQPRQAAASSYPAVAAIVRVAAAALAAMAKLWQIAAFAVTAAAHVEMP